MIGIVVVAPSETLRPVRSTFVKPDSFAVTEYIPGARTGNRYRPASSVTAGSRALELRGAQLDRHAGQRRPVLVGDGALEVARRLRDGRGRRTERDDEKNQEKIPS